MTKALNLANWKPQEVVIPRATNPHESQLAPQARVRPKHSTASEHELPTIEHSIAAYQTAEVPKVGVALQEPEKAQKTQKCKGCAREVPADKSTCEVCEMIETISQVSRKKQTQETDKPKAKRGWFF